MHAHVETTSSKFAIVFGGVVCLLLVIIKMIVGIPWQDVYSIWCVMAGTMNLYQWKKLPVKHQLYMGAAVQVAPDFSCIDCAKNENQCILSSYEVTGFPSTIMFLSSLALKDCLSTQSQPHSLSFPQLFHE